MTEAADYDVAIVGASLAGCTAAILLARRGLRVALLERQSSIGAYKLTCTHFIQPSAVPVIDRLGLAGAIEAAGGIRNGAHLWSRWGWIRPAPAAAGACPPFGYSLTRRRLDPLLRELAAGTKGIDLLLGHAVTGLVPGNGHIAGVEIQAGGGRPVRLMAGLVVAADGRHSTMARLTGAPAWTWPNRRFMAFAYFQDLPLASMPRQTVWFLGTHVAYASPNEDGLTVVTCAPVDALRPRFREDLEGSFFRFFDGVPEAPPLREAERVSKVRGMLEMPNVWRPAAHAGVAFVGDAAVASDPVWAVGCGWAFQSAAWLADCVADALLGAGNLGTALAQYRSKHRRALLGHHMLIAEFSRRRGLSPLEAMLLKAAVRDERTARHLAAFGARCIGPGQFLHPTALLRAAMVAAAPRSGARR